MTETEQSDQDYLTPSRAARLLGVTTKTLTRMAERGDIESRRLPSGHNRYSRESIEALLKARAS